MIERLRARIPTGAAEEFSPAKLTFYSHYYRYTRPALVVSDDTQQHSKAVRVGVFKSAIPVSAFIEKTRGPVGETWPWHSLE